MRAPLVLLGLTAIAGQARAQGSIASDLWRVAEGTLVVPAALASDGSAPLWTPAVSLPEGQRYRVGIEAIHAPSEVGVSGGIAAFSARVAGLGVLSLTYGQLGIGSVGYTETSPELVGGALTISNQVASIGLSRTLRSGLTAGVAARYLSGQLAFASRSQFGLDLGAQYDGIPHLRLGAATHFFDPLFGSSAQATSYTIGAEARSGAFNAWGARGTVALRYGAAVARGGESGQIVSAGLAVGQALSLDYGLAREHTASDRLWRSRLSVGVGAGNFSVRIARDGGVNDFGATYRFGLTAVFR